MTPADYAWPDDDLRAIRLRLSWPDDPYFDLRAFQRSGVDDPVAVGLVAGVDRTYDARRGA